MHYKLYSPKNNELSVIEQILLNRGLDYVDIPLFLNTDDSVRNDPFALSNMKKALNRIFTALVKQETIYVQVDSDCDGYTSAAVLINYLNRLFPASVHNHLAYGLHTKKHHGIAEHNIPEGCSLVIVPDASSNENELHKSLASRGIDVVVLDHHHAEIDEDDPAIIVNNQMCDYKNKHLSGVGIVYQFCKAMDVVLKVSLADDFLDLVALGLVADMMDLKSLETKRLIDLGCANVQNPFFHYMKIKNDYPMKGKVNPYTISFYIAPFINAITRSGTDDEKRLVFESLLEHKALRLIPSTKKGAKGQEELLVEQAVRVAGNVKRQQDDAKVEGLEDLRNMITNNQHDYGILIIQLENPVNTNLTGLLANQIMAEYFLPTLILNKRVDDETGAITWEGSGRGFAIDGIEDWRAYIEPYAMYAEGHSMAFGVGFTPEQLKIFQEHMIKAKSLMAFDKAYNVDYIFSMNDSFDAIIKEIASYGDIWGKGVAQPYVAIKDIILKKKDILLQGKGTLKIMLGSHKTNCIKFNAVDIYEKLLEAFPNEEATIKLTLIGTCSLNEYNGTVSPQIKLVDYEIDWVNAWGF